MVKASAPAKIIWFGDHAAVYGYPVLSMAINKGVTVEFKLSKYNCIDSHFFGSKKIAKNIMLSSENFYNMAKDALVLNKVDELNNLWDLSGHWYAPIQCLASKFECENNIFSGCNYELKIDYFGGVPKIPKGCGTGSALGAAISSALYQYFFQKQRRAKTLDDTLFFESLAHGNKHSGIDAHTVVKGGYFTMREGEIRRANGYSKMKVIIVDSGVPSRTVKQIEILENILDTNKSARKKLEEIGDIASMGMNVLKNKKINVEILKDLGKLMYKNHELLQDLEMSCPELDRIVYLSKKHGAWGAKLTGAGGGGAAIIISSKIDKLRKSLFQEGFKSFVTATNFTGVEARI